MRMNSRTIYVILIITIGYTILHCQRQDSVSRKAFLEKREAVFQARKDDYRLTNEKVDKLHEIGIDLYKYQKNNSYPKEMEATIYSDGVARVKIVDIIDWPGPVKQIYHTKIKALILEVLKGSANIGDTITFLKMGGTVIDPNIQNGLPLQEEVSDGDTNHILGEEYIVFLNKIIRDGYAQGQAKLRGGNLDKYQNDNKCYSALYSKRALINKGKVSFYGNTTDITQFKENIKKVTKIIENK